MIARFCLYSVLKNLRFFEPFFLLYLLAGPEHGGPALSYVEIGALIGFQKLVTAALETPSGIAADRWGRRRALALCFATYVIAFPLYAWASISENPIAILYAAQGLFGIGEAFRTGSHKGIMLDWLDHTGRDDHTRVIGLARLCSKISAGLAALAGGVIVYTTSSFTWLFLAATGPAVFGVLLMLSYPKWLEGDSARALERPGFVESLRRLRGQPGMILLFAQSVLFESQIKMSQHYLQPYLDTGIKSNDLTVIGGIGAVLIGAYYLVHDAVGGLASASASKLERRLGPHRLTIFQTLGVALVLTVAACLLFGWFVAGALGFIALALLQNARRPMFVTSLNELMDKPQRTTTLSLESQGRSLAYAIAAPLTGWAADVWGLHVALAAIAGVMALGLAVRNSR